MNTSVLLAIVLSLAAAEHEPPEGVLLSSSTSFVGSDEAGEPMVVTGTVFEADGETPVSNVVVYAYHTDKNGRYTDGKPNSPEHRLRGWMRTGSDGRYEFQSIRPGAYPGGSVPAHIHYWVTPEDRRAQRKEVFFEGDPMVSENTIRRAQQGYTIVIASIEKDSDGVWRCAADLLLEKITPQSP